MAIDLREYHPKWSLISRLIRVHRAMNRCEICRVPHGAIGFWYGRHWINKSPAICLFYVLVTQEGYGMRQAFVRVAETYQVRLMQIFLATAHLDGNRNNNRFENLKCICQRCHLWHDLDQHVASIKYGRNRHLNQLEIFNTHHNGTRRNKRAADRKGATPQNGVTRKDQNDIAYAHTD